MSRTERYRCGIRRRRDLGLSPCRLEASALWDGSWRAPRREMITDPATKIGRPRQVYTGPTTRDYVRVADR